MAESSATSVPSLTQRMEGLAALEPVPFPVISLYLDLRPNEVGRDDHRQFVRKVFSERAKGFAEQTPERDSFDRDVDAIRTYLETRVEPSWHGLALFACGGAGVFEAIPLEAPFDRHLLFIGAVPHLYPLAKVMDAYPRYAAVLLDTHTARILVFSLAATERDERITNEKTRRSQKGGWSQARYQRRAENAHLHHIKEVVETLDRIVRDEHIQQVIVAGEEVALPTFREQLPKHLASTIVDVIAWDRTAETPTILEATLAALRGKDRQTDADAVQELLDEWQSGGLGVAGPDATLSALERGQVEELIITGSPEILKPVQKRRDGAELDDVQVDSSAPQGVGDERRLTLADELVTRAHQTSARIRFIEDARLLEGIGGVGALLRFRI